MKSQLRNIFEVDQGRTDSQIKKWQLWGDLIMKATFKKKTDLDETSLAFPLVSSDMYSKALGLWLQKPGHLFSLTLETPGLSSLWSQGCQLAHEGLQGLICSRRLNRTAKCYQSNQRKLFKHTGDQYVKTNTAFIIVEITSGEAHCYRNYNSLHTECTDTIDERGNIKNGGAPIQGTRAHSTIE